MVSLSAEDGATIYYTMGAAPADPTDEDTEYVCAITITEATTIKAIAVKDGVSSTVASASYTLLKPSAPSFSVAATSFDTSFDVTISSPEGTTIKYTTDGSDPLVSGTAVDSNSQTITIPTSTTTVKAITIKNGVNSDVASVTYTYDDRTTPTFSLSTKALALTVNEDGAITVTTDSDGDIAFESSDEDHLFVDNTSDAAVGEIRADQEGEYTVTVSVTGSATYKDASDVVTVTVTKKTTATAISDASLSNTDLYSGTAAGTMAAAVTYNASPVDGATVAWTSSNEKVATITSAGVVTLVGKGSTIIRASYAGTAEYEASSATYDLKVTDSTPMIPYELVTSTSQLAAGDVITFVNEDAGNAIGAAKTNNFGTYKVSISDHAFEVKEGATGFSTFVLEKADPNYYFKQNGGTSYLASVSSSNNYMKLASRDNNAKASISISGGNASIVYQGTYTHNVMQYNSGSNLFACYASASQAAVQIYKKVKFANAITTTTAYTLDVVNNNETELTLTATATNGTVTYAITSATLEEDVNFTFDTETGELLLDDATPSGVIVITASAAETSTHKAAEDVVITITVVGAKVDPTIMVSNVEQTYGADYTLDTSDFLSGNVTLASSNLAVATVEGLVITPVAAGETTITVSTAANSMYNAGSDTFVFTVTAPAGLATTVAGSAVTTTFTDNDFAYSGTGLTWSSTDTATRSFESSGNARGIQIGAAKGEFTISTPNTATVTAVSMVVSTNNGNTNTLAVTVGGEDFTTVVNSSDVTTFTMPNANNQTVTFTGVAKGDIVITVDDAIKTVWFKSITVTYANTVPVTFNSAGYATVSSAYPLDFSAASNDYSAWQVTEVGSDGTIALDRLSTAIKGGQGVLLYSETQAGETVNILTTNATAVLGTNMLKAALVSSYFAANSIYGLAGNTFQPNSAGTIRAGKAYLDYDDVQTALSADVKNITLVFRDLTTGVQTNRTIGRAEAEAIFDLSGRRLTAPRKGINIVGGRKVVVR